MQDNRRVQIVDYNHMAHTYMNSKYRLSKTLCIDGESKLIDTTVQSGTIKAIHRWSNGGSNPTAVCFDSPVPARKAYFAKNFDMPVEGDKGYKGGRSRMPQEMFDAIGMTKDILVSAGVSCFKGNGYEADDLVFACINAAKQAYPGMPIDVITNDADLLPLVDDTVSVFLRSKKQTWAESPDIEKLHYVQVTPDNYQEVVEDRSDFRKFLVPYNSILLYKLLRGDTSDNIRAKEISKKFPPTKYNELVDRLYTDGKDLSSLFRYGKCKEVILSRSTGEVVTDIASHDRNDLMVRYDDPEELDRLIDTMCWYIEDDAVLDHMRKMYRAMNLNQAYIVGNLTRRPAKLKEPMKPFSEGLLQEKVAPLDINLKLKLY